MMTTLRTTAMCTLLSSLVLAGCASAPTKRQPDVAGAVAPRAIAYIPHPDRPVCAVTRIVDGDTVDLWCQSAGTRTVRLVGFDTPETFQPGCPSERALGESAKTALKSALQSARIITPKLHGTGKYGRALVSLDLDGVPLARRMVERGVAVPYDGGKRINWCQKIWSMSR